MLQEPSLTLPPVQVWQPHTQASSYSCRGHPSSCILNRTPRSELTALIQQTTQRVKRPRQAVTLHTSAWNEELHVLVAN